jgi:hypothetical protein
MLGEKQKKGEEGRRREERASLELAIALRSAWGACFSSDESQGKLNFCEGKIGVDRFVGGKRR